MEQYLLPVLAWLEHSGRFIFPTLIALWMAVGDLRTRRIPNRLTLGTALAGLAVRGLTDGLAGLGDGLLGLVAGFSLLFGFYLMGGMGAGDVKALAALGTWLGLRLTLFLFLYMALAGGLLVLAYLWWRGLLTARLKRLGSWLLSWILLRPHGGGAGKVPGSGQPAEKPEGVPYAVALAVGMAVLCWQQLFRS